MSTKMEEMLKACLRCFLEATPIQILKTITQNFTVFFSFFIFWEGDRSRWIWRGPRRGGSRGKEGRDVSGKGGTRGGVTGHPRASPLKTDLVVEITALSSCQYMCPTVTIKLLFKNK
jgi:hypothetical protein